MTQTNQRRSRRTSCTLGFVFAAFLAACGADPSLPSEEQDSSTGSEWIVNHAESAAASGVTAEDLSEPDPRVVAAANCVYIAYCNEPGARGTVCRAKTGCASLEATVAECDADVKAVCGSAVKPKYIDYY